MGEMNQIEKAVELLPCPFCGGSRIVKGERYFAMCVDCGATGPERIGDKAGVKKLFVDWNTQPAADRLKEFTAGDHTYTLNEYREHLANVNRENQENKNAFENEYRNHQDTTQQLSQLRTAYKEALEALKKIRDTRSMSLTMIERAAINGPPNSGADGGSEGFEFVTTIEFTRTLERELVVVTKERNELLSGVSRLTALSISQNEWIEEALETLKQHNLPIPRGENNE